MKDTYTILLMSSDQDSVRQFSIKRWFALFLGLSIILAFALTINFAISGRKHGTHYKTELQDEVANTTELQQTNENYKKRIQAIEGEMEDIRKMNKAVREYLGIDRGKGVLGQGGGGGDIEMMNDNELTTNSIIEMQPAPMSNYADFANDPLISQIIQVKHEMIPIYEYVRSGVKGLRERPSILPILVSEGDGKLSYWFSSGFGRRIDPLTEKLRFHNGLDIAAPRGTPVIATADGIIDQVGRDAFFGKMVRIEHKATQMKTLYGHLASHADGLQVGQKVKRYDIIGYVGNSGRSTGLHLHYGVSVNGKWQNPKHHIILNDPPK